MLHFKLAVFKYLRLFTCLAVETNCPTVSPKKRKNNKGKAEDVNLSDAENSDPKQKLSFDPQDGKCCGCSLYGDVPIKSNLQLPLPPSGNPLGI